MLDHSRLSKEDRRRTTQKCNAYKAKHFTRHPHHPSLPLPHPPPPPPPPPPLPRVHPCMHLSHLFAIGAARTPSRRPHPSRP
eukprot:881947-Prymnesium_polylepis.1